MSLLFPYKHMKTQFCKGGKTFRCGFFGIFLEKLK